MREHPNGNEEVPGENAIEARAAEWVIRLDGAEPGAAPLAELDEWLEEDPRHQGAFLRAQAAWKSFDRLQILQGETATAVEARILSRRVLLGRILVAGGAGLALSAAVAIGFFRTGRNLILTPVGEIRRVPLVDGSVAAVNTNSQVAVEIKPYVREITVEKGEAWFAVAKDKARPFVVSSGDVRVRAVGTAFSVRRRDDGADVLVTEGTVETWTVGNESDRRQVTAGSKVFVSDIAGPSEVVGAATQIDRALAWREGEIALDGETLAQAAEEFNRYNERKLTVDPALVDQRLVGWFHTNEPDTFAHAAASVLGVRVTETQAEIHLSPDAVPSR